MIVGLSGLERTFALKLRVMNKRESGVAMRQESLFNPDKSSSSPLAYRVRPVTLADFKGQEHLLGPGKLLRQLIAEDQLPSLIFGDHRESARPR